MRKGLPSIRLRVTVMSVALVLAIASIALALIPQDVTPSITLAEGPGPHVVMGIAKPEQRVLYALRLATSDRASVSVATTSGAPISLAVLPPSAESANATPSAIASGLASPLALELTASEPGTYYAAIEALETTASYTLTYRRIRASSVELTVPASVSDGSSCQVIAIARDSDGAGVPNEPLSLYYSYDRRSWRLFARPQTDASGTAAAAFKPTRRTFIRARLSASSNYLASPYSTLVSTAPRMGLPTPSARSHVLAWTSFPVTGYVTPRQPPGSHTVVLKAYRLEGDAWVLRHTATTTNEDFGTYTRYRGSMTLPGSAASRWRVVAYHPGDSRHAATTSAARYVSIPMPAFKRLPFKALAVPDSLRPFYVSAPTSATGDTGPAKRVVNGVEYDMALRLAETGYKSVNFYVQTGDRLYLERAKAQADRLIQIKHAEGDGWFYPSTFDYRLSSRPGGTLLAPWYSGIAQGAAVGFLARLYEVTHEAKYGDAAEHTLESFLVPPATGRTWVSRVEGSGYLVVEEYPESALRYVLNGHMEAAMGLYDYYIVTGDTRALALYQGALASVARYGESFRNPGQCSAYSLSVRSRFLGYHRHHVGQFLQLYAISGDRSFARLANHFYDDYRSDSIDGSVTVAAGLRTIYRFSSSGSVVSSKTLASSEQREFAVLQRTRIPGQVGYWFQLAGPGLDGYWMREKPSAVFYPGTIALLEYPTPVSTSVRDGSWDAFVVDGRGEVVATEAVEVGAPEKASIGARAVVSGTPSVFVVSGSAAGKWLPERAVVMP